MCQVAKEQHPDEQNRPGQIEGDNSDAYRFDESTQKLDWWIRDRKDDASQCHNRTLWAPGWAERTNQVEHKSCHQHVKIRLDNPVSDELQAHWDLERRANAEPN